MRLIDADALKRNFEANTPVFAQDLVPGICAIIDLARTIDAVPVERCKNFWYPCVPNDDWVVCATGERKGRYIDADKITYSWQIDLDGQEHDGVTLQSIINKMPSIDAIPLEWIAGWMGKHQGLGFDGWNYAVGTMVRDWAERKES